MILNSFSYWTNDVQKSYKTVDEAYKDMAQMMTYRARAILKNPDFALDCVHEVFSRAQAYKNKHPKRNIVGFFLMRKLNSIVAQQNKKLDFSLYNDNIGSKDGNLNDCGNKVVNQDPDINDEDQ